MPEGAHASTTFDMIARLLRVFSIPRDLGRVLWKVIALKCENGICVLTCSQEHDEVSPLHVRCSRWYATFDRAATGVDAKIVRANKGTERCVDGELLAAFGNTRAVPAVSGKYGYAHATVHEPIYHVLDHCLNNANGSPVGIQYLYDVTLWQRTG